MKIRTDLPPTASTGAVDPQRVAAIVADVRQRGDTALADWTRQFDRRVPDSWRIGPDQLAQA